MIKKSYYIVLKPANDTKFLRKSKAPTSTPNFICCSLNILCVTYFVTSLSMHDLQTSDMRQIR